MTGYYSVDDCYYSRLKQEMLTIEDMFIELKKWQQKRNLNGFLSVVLSWGGFRTISIVGRITYNSKNDMQDNLTIKKKCIQRSKITKTYLNTEEELLFLSAFS